MPKVLILGIDGGTWTALQPALDRGDMPFLKNLIKSGASGVLESTIPAITPAAWAGFQTGMNPGDHGVFDFYRWDKSEKTLHLVQSQDLSLTLWDIVSRNQKKVGVLNVPMTYPPKPINGYMVSGVLTPSLKSDFTYPSQLAAELLRAVPQYRIINAQDAEQDMPLVQFESYVTLMADMARYRADAAEHILRKEPLDVFMAHFMSSDVLQHRLWCYMDNTNPLYDAKKHEFIIKHFYRPLDQALQKVHQAFAQNGNNNDFTTLVLSDHGFQSHYKTCNLGLWSYQQGYLKLNPRSEKIPVMKKLTKTLRIGKLLTTMLPRKTVANMERSLRLDTGRFDWNHSTLFCLGSSGEAFIHLLESNDQDKIRTAKQLIEKLYQIEDPENHTSVVKQVYSKEELYHGKFFDNMPDLVIVPTPGYSFTSVFREDSELFHSVTLGKNTHMGMHHPDGILVAAGNAIKTQNDIRTQIVNMAPTILYCLGLPLPKNSDGKVCESLFTSDFRNQNPVTITDQVRPQADSDQKNVYSQEDQQEIRKRLENMGYL